MSERLYTIYQVADLLGSTPGEVLTWIRQGRLDYRGDDGRRQISQGSLVRFLRREGIDIEQVLAKAVLGAGGQRPVGDGKAQAHGNGSRPARQDAPRSAVAAADDLAGKYVADVVPHPPGQGQERAEEAPASREPVAPREAAAPAVAEHSAGGQPGGNGDGQIPAPPSMDPLSAPADQALDAEIVAPDPAQSLAEAILKDAVARRATAIHLEPTGGQEGGAAPGLALRLRVDGVLQEKVNFRLRLPPAVAEGLVAHFLTRAGLAGPGTTGAGTTGVSPVGETKEQSGWFASAAAGDARFRLSVCTTRAGRRLVIFVEGAEADRPALKDLVLSADDEKALHRLLRERSGLILVTARPGEGASTTLRAMAGELAGPHRSLFWIGAEDCPPVEGASLLPLGCDGTGGAMGGLCGAKAVRSAAGQDADLIAVAEIWDSQTLLAAAEAALAGRLVLARLHERSAPAALELLRRAGLAPWRLATALLGVVARRDVRKLCPACRREESPADEVLHLLGLSREEVPAMTFAATGCKQCYSTGYAGRTGAFSILEVNEELAGLLREGAPAAAIEEAARKAGMKTLREAGLELARQGETSLAELARAF
jgi:type II secretory ATPase GspE/PulE/Tfp pilus assembly ATPase PilB-like protein